MLKVARMAYDLLEKNDPKALSEANTILEVLKRDNPKVTHKEDAYPFVECATLADDIRMAGG